MTTIYLVRHAEAEGNLYRILQGQYDSNLTARGYRQLSALKRRFLDVPLDKIYASDLTRATATATALSVPKGLEIHRMRELREISVGSWEGKTWEELKREAPEMNHYFNHAPDLWQAEGSETYAQVRDRMLAALKGIIRDNPGKTVAIASHGGALRTLLGALEGLTLRETGETGHSDNTAVSKLEAEGDEIRVVYRDDASHLPDELSTFAKQKWHRGDRPSEPGLRYLTGRTETALELTALLGDREAGHLSAHLEPDCLRISRYELIPDLRGKGYGIQPLGQAVYFARANNREFIRLSAPAESAGFFAYFGFTPLSDGEWELDIRRRICEIP